MTNGEATGGTLPYPCSTPVYAKIDRKIFGDEFVVQDEHSTRIIMIIQDTYNTNITMAKTMVRGEE